MYQKRYVIRYDWAQLRVRGYGYYDYFETDHFLVFLLKFLLLKRKYKIMDVYYRDDRDKE